VTTTIIETHLSSVTYVLKSKRGKKKKDNLLPA